MSGKVKRPVHLKLFVLNTEATETYTGGRCHNNIFQIMKYDGECRLSYVCDSALCNVYKFLYCSAIVITFRQAMNPVFCAGYFTYIQTGEW
jgi:hypothetical protein